MPLQIVIKSCKDQKSGDRNRSAEATFYSFGIKRKMKYQRAYITLAALKKLRQLVKEQKQLPFLFSPHIDQRQAVMLAVDSLHYIF